MQPSQNQDLPVFDNTDTQETVNSNIEKSKTQKNQMNQTVPLTQPTNATLNRTTPTKVAASPLARMNLFRLSRPQTTLARNINDNNEDSDAEPELVLQRRYKNAAPPKISYNLCSNNSNQRAESAALSSTEYNVFLNKIILRV